MADNTESIGGVSVSITGDAGPLQASFAAAQSSAEVAGAKVASAFNAGAAATEEMAQAAVSAAVAQAGFAASTERSTEALGHQVTQIQAVSGAIRTFDGNQGIRAAERFLTMIPGLGAALQVAFPIIGAVALFEMFTRLLAKSEELTAAEKDLQSQVEATNKAFTDEAEAIDRVNAKYLGQKFGAAAGAQGEVAAARAQLADLQKDVQKEKDQLGVLATQAQGEILKRPTGGSVIEENYAPKFAAQGEKIQQALAKVATAEKELQLKVFEAGQTGLSQAGQQSAAYAALQEEQLKHTSDTKKAYAEEDIQQSHAAASEQIAALHNRSLAAAETAEEELRVEQAKQKNLTAALAEEMPKRLALIRQAGAAESQGKPESDQSRIALQTQTKLEAAQRDADNQSLQQSARVSAAQATAAAATATAIRDEAKAQKDFNLELEHEATLWKDRTVKAAEFQAKFNETLTGVHPDTQREKDKTEPVNQQALQRLQGGNAVQQQLALAIQLKQVGIETNNEIQSRIGNLQQELAAAQKTNVPIETRLKLEQEILQAKIQQAAANGQGDQTDKLAAAQNQIQQTLVQWKSLNFGDIAQSSTKAVIAGVDGISQAMARAIVQGKNFGQAVTQSLKQIGTSILASAIETGLKRILSSLLGLIPGFQAVSGAQSGAAAQQKAIASASVLTAAGEAAAWGFESVMAALPFPINVTVAPEVATAAFAQTSSFGAFAAGTDSAPGGFAMVGEKGPEIMYVPRGAQITPNHKIGSYAGGTSGARSFSSSSSTSIGELHVHAHGVSNPDAFAKAAVAAIPREIKRQTSKASPYSN